MSGDLFGETPKPLANPKGMIRLQLDVDARRSTEKAWFLTRPGDAQGFHVGRSKAARGTGPWINHWTVPRWLAAQNGWL